jgi:hypothetical protein
VQEIVSVIFPFWRGGRLFENLHNTSLSEPKANSEEGKPRTETKKNI